jgi:hypothetical protein
MGLRQDWIVWVMIGFIGLRAHRRRNQWFKREEKVVIPMSHTDVGSSFETVCYSRKTILQQQEMWIII